MALLEAEAEAARQQAKPSLQFVKATLTAPAAKVGQDSLFRLPADHWPLLQTTSETPTTAAANPDEIDIDDDDSEGDQDEEESAVAVQPLPSSLIDSLGQSS